MSTATNTDSCKIITGATLILRRDGKILLFKRNIPGKIAFGNFALPGGTVEHNETLKQAASREAAEELGIDIAEEDLSIVHMLRLREKYDQTTSQTKQILMLYFMEVSHWNGEPQNLEPQKHSELTWFEIDSLPDNLFQLNRVALDDIKNGIFFGEHGW